MYTLILANGTTLSNLTRAKNGSFWFEGNTFAANILTDDNLAFATIEQDGELDEILVDYTLQNLYVQGGYIQFKLVPLKKYEDEEQYRKDRDNKEKEGLLYDYGSRERDGREGVVRWH